MNTVFSVYKPGVIALIELFTYADEELRQFVVYTYYDKMGVPLYVGCSKDFYNAHYFNLQRLPCANEIEFVGFVFFEDEETMKDAKKHYIRAREPKFARSLYKKLPCIPGCDENNDDLVVSNAEMMQRWREWLSSDEE